MCTQRRGLSILIGCLTVLVIFVVLPKRDYDNSSSVSEKSRSSDTEGGSSDFGTAADGDGGGTNFMNNIPVINRFIGGGIGGGGRKCGDRCDRVFSDVFYSLVAGYRQCVLGKLENAMASQALPKAVSDCIGDALWRLLDVKMYENRDDEKQAILPPSDVEARGEWARCTEVTLGVGRDIEAELLLRRAQPHCRFFAADPIKEAGQIFHELGPYFEVAVAAEAGMIGTWIQTNKMTTIDYKYVELKAITLTDLLRNYVNTSKVDYLLMDNEGAEYQLLGRMSELEADNISVCQISAELHRPFTKYNTTEGAYGRLMKQIVANSSFVPIWSITTYHMRSFFVNVRDPYCVGKYFRSKWCGDFNYYKEKKK